MTIVQDIIQCHFVREATGMHIVSTEPAVNEFIRIDFGKERYHIVITSTMIFFCSKLTISEFCSFAVQTRSKILLFRAVSASDSTAGSGDSAFFFLGIDFDGREMYLCSIVSRFVYASFRVFKSRVSVPFKIAISCAS